MTYAVSHGRRPLSTLRHFEPNPREIDKDDFLVLCRSIIAFGIVDTLVVAEDGRVLGGNQRLDSLIQLDRGFDAPDGERLQWSLPGGLVDVMVVSGADEPTLKAINVALNKHAGKFIEDEVAAILREVRDAHPELLGAIDTQDEVDRLLRDVSDGDGGSDPPRARGVPSITLQFTSAAAHTRVKQALGKAQAQAKLAKGEEKVPSGDLLDRLLADREQAKGPKKAKPRAKN